MDSDKKRIPLRGTGGGGARSPGDPRPSRVGAPLAGAPAPPSRAGFTRVLPGPALSGGLSHRRAPLLCPPLSPPVPPRCPLALPVPRAPGVPRACSINSGSGGHGAGGGGARSVRDPAGPAGSERLRAASSTGGSAGGLCSALHGVAGALRGAGAARSGGSGPGEGLRAAGGVGGWAGAGDCARSLRAPRVGLGLGSRKAALQPRPERVSAVPIASGAVTSTPPSPMGPALDQAPSSH